MASNLTVNDHTKTEHRQWSLTEMRQMHMCKILWWTTNGLYPSLKHPFQQYKVHNHCALLEMLVVFSLCAAAAVYVTPKNNSPPAAPIDISHPPHARHIHSPVKIMALAAMYTLHILHLSVFLHLLVSIGIHCRSDSSRFKHQQKQDFPHRSRPAPRCTQPPVHGVTGLFPSGKAAEAWCWQPTPI
jgi:hypothetical protein